MNGSLAFQTLFARANLRQLAAPLLIVMILSMMVLPLPPFLLDLFFTFNIALSMGYAISNWVGTEPNAGDSAYLDLLTRHHLPPGVIAAAIFMPAIIDAIRFFAPESWLPWLSRLSKTALIGLVLAV